MASREDDPSKGRKPGRSERPSRAVDRELSLASAATERSPASFFRSGNTDELSNAADDMKPTIAADEMFPEGIGPYMDLEEAGGSSGLLMDLAANEKAVHVDFFNDFEDLFDDDDLH